MRRKRLRALLVSVAALLGAPLLLWALLPQPPETGRLAPSSVVRDREGRLLRVTLTPDEKYRLHTALPEMSAELVGATLLQEDQHFWAHPGCNPIATARALFYWAAGQRGRGGSSTISMQLARLRYRLHTRTPRGKLVQIWRALEIERHATKEEILEEYLNRAPYGGNIEGAAAASLLYFDKPPARLTRGEALLLAVLPQSPTRRAPRAGAPASMLAAASRLSARQKTRAPLEAERFPTLMRRHPQAAPHFVREVLATAGPHEATTLDLDLQRLVERRIAAFLETHQQLDIENAAALLLDTRNMEVLAQAGSADFANGSIDGQVDGTRSRRSPGSTLKPFIYALAMDQGLIHPLTLLADAPRRFGEYAPENFDGDFAGPIKAEEALIRSRNVPAVALAQKLAHPTLYELLKKGGVNLPREESFYGLSLVLGGGEVTMEELARLYAALANGGRLRPLYRTTPHPPANGGARLFSQETAFLTLDMLQKLPRPDLNQPEEGVAWKTGTSMGFRDAWSLAVFDHFVLGVWVGNFKGQRNPALVGRTCAAPLLFQIIDAMRSEGRTRPRAFRPPPGANLREVELCAVSGQLPTAACSHRCHGWFIPGVSPICACQVHREIIVDCSTGLRLPLDDGTEEVRREIYEFWPSDLQALFAQAGLPRRRPPPFAPGAGVESIQRTGQAPEIVSPATGRTYAVRAGDRAAGSIALLARCDADVGRIYWFADKTYLGAAAPREHLDWRPAPGRYRVLALDDHGRSSSSSVTLEAAGAGSGDAENSGDLLR